MPWNEEKQLGRYEVLITDRQLHDFAEAAAQRAGMSMNVYLQSLARMMMNANLNDLLPLLLAQPSQQHGAPPAPPAPSPAPAQPTPRSNTLFDNLIDT